MSSEPSRTIDTAFPLVGEYSDWLNFNRAYGPPPVRGLLKAAFQDFQVFEDLGIEFAGNGEHLYLHVEKQDLGTSQAAKHLAGWAGIRPMDVGYSGMKDRAAVTRQWFSLYLGKRELDIGQFQVEGMKILEAERHSQKLRRGMHRLNRFKIRLTQAEGDWSAFVDRCEKIKGVGVPSYFGEQRFGYQANNLQQAHQMLVLNKRFKQPQKGIYLSAARSYLFNHILSQRVADTSWNQALAGDCVTTEDQFKGFCEGMPTGPMWGRGRLATGDAIQTLEQNLTADFAGWCYGMEHQGLKQERRPLVLVPGDFSWQVLMQSGANNTAEELGSGNLIELNFSLPVGAYATSLLRELCDYRLASQS